MRGLLGGMLWLGLSLLRGVVCANGVCVVCGARGLPVCGARRSVRGFLLAIRA